MYTGSMLGAGALMFAVWGYVISHAQGGKVELNTKHIAFLLGETEPDVASTIEKLCSPDPSSRSKESDGKRLIRIGEFLYEVVNHEKYRQMATEAERRDYQKNWDRTHRQRPKKQKLRKESDKIRQHATKADSPYAYASASESASVSESGGESEGGNLCEQPSLKEVLAYAQKIGLAEWKAEDVFNEMEACGWKDFLKRPIVKWQSLFTRTKVKWEADGRPTGPPKNPNAQAGSSGQDDWRQSL